MVRQIEYGTAFSFDVSRLTFCVSRHNPINVRKTYRGEFLAFISSIKGRTINKSACGAKVRQICKPASPGTLQVKCLKLNPRKKNYLSALLKLLNYKCKFIMLTATSNPPP